MASSHTRIFRRSPSLFSRRFLFLSIIPESKSSLSRRPATNASETLYVYLSPEPEMKQHTRTKMHLETRLEFCRQYRRLGLRFHYNGRCRGFYTQKTGFQGTKAIIIDSCEMSTGRNTHGDPKALPKVLL